MKNYKSFFIHKNTFQHNIIIFQAYTSHLKIVNTYIIIVHILVSYKIVYYVLCECYIIYTWMLHVNILNNAIDIKTFKSLMNSQINFLKWRTLFNIVTWILIKEKNNVNSAAKLSATRNKSHDLVSFVLSFIWNMITFHRLIALSV